MVANLGKDGVAARFEEYYTRKGNRTVFSNGMTLNQLALAMWERLGFREIDASVLSRFLKGERLLNLRQLGVLCNLLKIRGKQVRKLEELLNCEILSRLGQGENFEYYKRSVFVENMFAAIRNMRRAMAYDSPMLAVDWLDVLKEKVTDRYLKEGSDRSKSEYLLLFGELLLQERIILLDTFPFMAVAKRLQEVGARFGRVGEMSGEKEYTGYSEAMKGRSYFHYGRYHEAVVHDMAAAKLINNIEEKCVVLMRVAIELGCLNRPGECLAAQGELETTLSQAKDDIQCFGLKGIAQANCKLGHEKAARKYLDQAWSVYDRRLTVPGKYRYVRAIQLKFAEYQFSKTFGGETDSQARKYLGEIANLSSVCGYESYQIGEASVPSVVL